MKRIQRWWEMKANEAPQPDIRRQHGPVDFLSLDNLIGSRTRFSPSFTAAQPQLFLPLKTMLGSRGLCGGGASSCHSCCRLSACLSGTQELLSETQISHSEQGSERLILLIFNSTLLGIYYLLTFFLKTAQDTILPFLTSLSLFPSLPIFFLRPLSFLPSLFSFSLLPSLLFLSPSFLLSPSFFFSFFLHSFYFSPSTLFLLFYPCFLLFFLPSHFILFSSLSPSFSLLLSLFLFFPLTHSASSLSLFLLSLLIPSFLSGEGKVSRSRLQIRPESKLSVSFVGG